MGYIGIYFVLHLTKSRLMLIEDNSSENENLQKWIFEASHFEKNVEIRRLLEAMRLILYNSKN